ncbi:hypothetical protein CUR21_18480 [Pseudorhodobacter sp. MZDSW-24AT]|nr:hypothetical protein CUR21_18480 [Pseudorhodobacter sp. MZDSW-24AT]
MIGLFKTEVINQIGPWKSMREVEWETLKWLDWYSNRRLLGPIGYIPPAEAEEAFYANLNTLDMVASSLNKPPSGKPGAVQCRGGGYARDGADAGLDRRPATSCRASACCDGPCSTAVDEDLADRVDRPMAER